MKTKWYDIDEKLPSKNEDYLVCDKNGVMFIALYDPQKNIWYVNGSNSLYYSDEGYLRFWSKLPDEPEGLNY